MVIKKYQDDVLFIANNRIMTQLKVLQGHEYSYDKLHLENIKKKNYRPF